MARRRVLLALKLVAVWLVLIIGALGALHWSYLRRIRPRQFTPLTIAQIARANHAPIELAREVGYLRLDRAGLDRATPDHPGIIRILALGDSFTYGDEVDAGLDFPSQLQRLFAEAGLDNVEVMNFGNSGIGFFEAMQIWERLASRYQPDFILLGPECFQKERDLTFHSLGQPVQNLHGRYILSGPGLRFVDVIGGDRRTIWESYHQLLPRLDYLRYDRDPPDVLQMLLPDGKSVANPFYYSSLTADQERDEIDLRLLRELMNGPQQVVMVHFEWPIRVLGERLGDRMLTVGVPIPTGSEYRRIGGHLSGAGNARVARMFFQLLSHVRPLTIDGVALTPPEDHRAAPTATFDNFSRIEVLLDDHVAARLIHSDVSDCGPFDPHESGARSFLVLYNRDAGILEALFVPLDFVPSPGAAVEMKIAGARYPLGRVVQPTAELALAMVAVPAQFVVNYDWISTQLTGSGVVLVDDRPVADIAPRSLGGIWVRPRAGRIAILRPAEHDALDVSRLPASGSLFLRLDGKRLVRIGGYQRTSKTFDYDDRGLRRFIGASPLDAHRAEIISR